MYYCPLVCLRSSANFLLGQAGGHVGGPEEVPGVGFQMPPGPGIEVAHPRPAYEVNKHSILDCAGQTNFSPV